jgi:hypothetical protein
MRYLLDTNFVSDEAKICTSIIVAAELRYAAGTRGSPRLATQLEAVLGALEVLPFEAPADSCFRYGTLAPAGCGNPRELVIPGRGLAREPGIHEPRLQKLRAQPVFMGFRLGP